MDDEKIFLQGAKDDPTHEEIFRKIGKKTIENEIKLNEEGDSKLKKFYENSGLKDVIHDATTTEHNLEVSADKQQLLYIGIGAMVLIVIAYFILKK